MVGTFARRVALVTGAGAGLGQATAVELARDGVRVALLDIDPERLEQTKKFVERVSSEALALPTDMMNTDEVRASVATAVEHFGRIDILVNNAGGVSARRFLDQSERSWRRHIDLNMVSMLSATSAAAPLMIAAGRGGAILNVSSIEGLRAAPLYAVYAACKAGMISFTKSLALELGEHGIRVNALAPDHTATAGMRGMMSGAVDPDDLPARAPDEQAAVEAYVPLGREGNATEFAKVACFLCSDDAAYITGATINVDGGTYAAGGWARSTDGNWSLYGPDGTMRQIGRGSH
jgi:NAD(P)-dependent dehydrogenase (short-subunit alcohol dehydrogenase family)